jgi:hypothetical protein
MELLRLPLNRLGVRALYAEARAHPATSLARSTV